MKKRKKYQKRIKETKFSERDKQWVIRRLAGLQGEKRVNGKIEQTGPSSKVLEKKAREERKRNYGSAPGRDKILAVLNKLEREKKIKWVNKTSVGSMIILYDTGALRRARLLSNFKRKEIGERINKLEKNASDLRITHSLKRPRRDMPGFLPADYFEWVVLKNEIMSLPFKIFQQSRKPEAEKEAELLDISDFCSDKIRKLENILKIVRKTIGDTDDIVGCISGIVEFTHHDAGKGDGKIMDVMKSYRLKEPSKPLESRYGQLERYFKYNYHQ
jgi:hypothetical protein